MYRATHILTIAAVTVATTTIAGCSSMGGMNGSSNAQRKTAKQAKLADKAQQMLQKQMTQPNAKRIPNRLVADARCIGVFPSVIQGGLIIGGGHGKGLVTCRQKSGGFKSANPAVYSITGGTIGLQAGAQKSSVVLLFETRQSVNALLKSKLKLGSQLSVTAGPSGYNHKATKTSSPVVAYVTSQKGLYAGANLSGTKMSFKQSANQALYGNQATSRAVLLGGVKSAPEMASFKQTLQRFAPTSQQRQSDNGQSDTSSNDDSSSQHNDSN